MRDRAGFFYGERKLDETNDLLMSVIEAPLFNPEPCEQIVEFAKNFKAEIGTLGGQGKQEDKTRNSKIIWLRESQGGGNSYLKK